MSKPQILLAVLLAVSQSSFLRTHDYWYTATRSAVEKNIPFADIPWGYCDQKCVYLEQVAKKQKIFEVDFVVMWFSESTFKPDFAACYFKRTNAVNGAVTYQLWNKAIKNAYFKENCGDGDEEEDYYVLTKGDKPKYKLLKKEGEGVGTDINY